MKLIAVLLALVAPLAAAGATREELKREREAIEADYARRAEACKTQFVVTPCLDKVRNGKQKALSQVAAQENALDASARQAKADARQKRIADKAAGAGGAASATAASPAASKAAAAPRKPVRAGKKPQPDENREAREQEKRADFEARQREIEAHRKKVEARNAERARTKPAPRPLPPPASTAGS